MNGLTKRQQEIVQFIQDYIQKNRIAPTYREMMQHFGFSSPGSIYKHIQVLIRKGFLAGEKNCSRSLYLLENKTTQSPSLQIDLEIPYIGLIRAGFPIETFAKTQTINVPDYLVHSPENTYVLKAVGESLNEELIADGDFLIIEARSDVVSGETVVATINHHDSIVKKIVLKGEYLHFIGKNPMHHPIILKSEVVEVQGVVRGLIRQYQ